MLNKIHKQPQRELAKETDMKTKKTKYYLRCDDCGKNWIEKRDKNDLDYQSFTCPKCGGYESIFVEVSK